MPLRSAALLVALLSGCSRKAETPPPSVPSGPREAQPSRSSDTKRQEPPDEKPQELRSLVSIPLAHPEPQVTAPGEIDFDGCNPRLRYPPAYGETYDLDGSLLFAGTVQPPVVAKFRWNDVLYSVRPTYLPSSQRVVDSFCWIPENRPLFGAIRESGATPEAVGRFKVEPGNAFVKSVCVAGVTTYVNEEVWTRRGGSASSPQFVFSIIENGRYAGGGSGNVQPFAGGLLHLSGIGGTLSLRQSPAGGSVWESEGVVGFATVPDQTAVALWTETGLRILEGKGGRTLAEAAQAAISEVVASPDGKLFAAVFPGGVTLLDRAGKPVNSYAGRKGQPVGPVRFCPAGDHLVAQNGATGTLVVYDGSFVERRPASLGARWIQHLIPAEGPDGFRVIDASMRFVQEWRIDFEKKRLAIRSQTERPYVGVSSDWLIERPLIRAGVWSPEATVYATREGGAKGRLRFRDAATCSFGSLSRTMAAFEYSFEGRRFLDLWDLPEGNARTVCLSDVFESALSSTVASVGGRMLLVNYLEKDRRTRTILFDASVPGLREIRRLEAPGGVLSPGGQWLLRGRIVEGAASGKKVMDLPGGWGVPSAFSPDERRLASISNDGLRVADLKAKQVLPTFPAPPGARVWFLTDRRLIVASSKSLEVVEIGGE